MKKICKKCGSAWETNDALARRIQKCPFCGYDFAENSSIASFLHQLVIDNGIDVLKNGAKINGMLADYFPKNTRERASIRTAYEYGVGKVFCEIAVSNTYESSNRILILKKRLADEAWLSGEAIEFVCGVFSEAINYNDKGSKQENFSQVENFDCEKEEIKAAATNDLPSNNKNVEDIKKCENKEEEALRLLELAREKEDTPDIAFRYYEKAAKLGNAEAMNILGYLYEKGEGVKQDLQHAIRLYSDAAKAGNRGAQHNLGYLYYTGTGVKKDLIRAFKLFMQAAEQDSPGAQNNIGVMYEYGQGVEKDVKKAIIWYNKAMENGNEDGATNYERLKAQGL